MLSVTFTLTGREKTFTKKGLEECVSTFLKEYGEAIDEVVKIHIVDVEDNSEQMTGKILEQPGAAKQQEDAKMFMDEQLEEFWPKINKLLASKAY